MKVITFPSIIEENESELKNVFKNLVDGIKIHFKNESYVVGKLAATEGISPHKIINCSPADDDYKILALSSILLAGHGGEQPLNLTVGFPFSTYQSYRDETIEFLQGKHEIRFDKFSIGKVTTDKVTIEVASVNVLPEIIGCAFAFKDYTATNGNIFVVNLGFGTFEACLTNESGIISRTVISKKGLQYAIDMAIKELNKTNYLGMRTENQFDPEFQKGSLFLNRKKMDITALRQNVLERYYKEVISPAIRNAWTDTDFSTSSSMYIAGGGAFYAELIASFKAEFGDMLDIQVLNEPHLATAKGYFSNAVKNAQGDTKPVGIDIGNAQTVIISNS